MSEEKLRIAWRAILDANSVVLELVQFFLGQKDIERADAASRIARQLRPSVDLWDLQQRQMLARYGKEDEGGKGQYTVDPKSESYQAYGKDLVDSLEATIPLPIEPIHLSVDEAVKLSSRLFSLLRPVLTIEK